MAEENITDQEKLARAEASKSLQQYLADKSERISAFRTALEQVKTDGKKILNWNELSDRDKESVTVVLGETLAMAPELKPFLAGSIEGRRDTVLGFLQDEMEKIEDDEIAPAESPTRIEIRQALRDALLPVGKGKPESNASKKEAAKKMLLEAGVVDIDDYVWKSIPGKGDNEKKARAQLRDEIRQLGDDINDGSVTEVERKLMEEINLKVDGLGDKSEVTVAPPPKVEKTKERTIEQDLADLQDPNLNAQDKADMYKDLQKKLRKDKPEGWKEMLNDIRKEMESLGGIGERPISAEQASKEFEVIKSTSYPDERIRLRKLSEWYGRYGSAMSEELKTEASAYYKEAQKKSTIPEGLVAPGGEKMSEVERKEKEGELWFRWGRKQLAEYLDYSKVDMLQQTKGNLVFRTEINNPFSGRSFVDALPYMPEEVKKRLMEEQKMVFELRRIYFDWIKAHAGLGAMASAVENKSYSLPTNDQLAPILNKLCSEDSKFAEGVGSHNVAIAIRLYYELATKGTQKPTDGDERDENGKRLIKLSVGRKEISVHNIFNTTLSDREVGEEREKVAKLCGGEYYEALGLVLAKFMGFAARGYDNTTPAINNSDIMGRLIWSAKINNWKNQSEYEDKRTYMWLPKEISNYFFTIDENTGGYRTENGFSLPIEAGVDLVSMKRKKGYFINKTSVKRRGRTVSESYEISKAETEVQKASSQDAHPSMEDLVLTDSLDKVNWSDSNYGVLQLMKFYESQSIDLYKMFDDLIKDKEGSLSIPELKKKRDTINLSLSHYAGNDKTKDHVGYLYVFSLLHRHSRDYLVAQKGEDSAKNAWQNKKMGDVVRMALDSGLISKDGEKKLRSVFGIGWYKG